jgi:hypothetical protein
LLGLLTHFLDCKVLVQRKILDIDDESIVEKLAEPWQDFSGYTQCNSRRKKDMFQVL